MKKQILTAALAFALMTPFAVAQTPAPATGAMTAAPAPMAMTATTPAEFVPMATHSNMFEIMSSEIALEKSQNAEVDEFAQQMITDHTKASEDMQAALQESDAGVEMPTELDERHQGMVDQLEAASAEEFDALYLQMQTQAHEEAVALFESYSTEGEDGPLKEFATATLPTLEMHLEMAQGMAQG